MAATNENLESIKQCRVFISYQWKSQEKVKKIFDALKSFVCIEPWMDIYKIRAGSNLYQSLCTGIQDCDVLLSCVSKEYVKSKNCEREIIYADCFNKPIIPIYIEKLPMSELGSIGFLLVRERFCSLYRRGDVFDNFVESEELIDILNGIENVLKSQKKIFQVPFNTKSSVELVLAESINEEVVRFRNDEPNLTKSVPEISDAPTKGEKADLKKQIEIKKQSSGESKTYKRSESIKSNGFSLEVHPVILYCNFLIRPKNILNPVGDKIYPQSDTNTHSLTRGGEPYYRPYGWQRYGIRISLMKYENDNWLSNDGNPDEWAVAYHGLRTSKSLEKILMINDNQGFRFQPHFSMGKAQRFAQNKDLNKKTNNYEKVCGTGIYLSTKASDAQQYTCDFVVKEKTYKVVLQCRVRPASIRRPNQNTIIVPKSVDIRPYGILVKTI